jgi:thiol-disulfide isomerase/thioredoxin
VSGVRRYATWLAILISLGVGACSGDAVGAALEACGAGTVARDNPLPAYTGELLDGSAVDLADFAEGTVVLVVWGSWCGPCRQEAPALVQSARELEQQGVRFLGVTVRDNAPAATAFVREFGLPYPSVLDTGSRLAADLGVAAPPATLVVKDSHIVAQLNGVVTAARIRCAVDAVGNSGERDRSGSR